MRIVFRRPIIERPRTSIRLHGVLLSAGASRAALPHGDAKSQRVPPMHHLVDTLNCGPVSERSRVFESDDFESICSALAADLQHVEVFGIAPDEDSAERWRDFTPTHHVHAERRFDDSWMARCPRLSREAVLTPISTGRRCPDFPPPCTNGLVELRTVVLGITTWDAGANQETS